MGESHEEDPAPPTRRAATASRASHVSRGAKVDRASQVSRRRSSIVMAIILIPIAIATAVGAFVLWPPPVGQSVNTTLVTDSTKGLVTLPAELLSLKKSSCSQAPVTGDSSGATADGDSSDQTAAGEEDPTSIGGTTCYTATVRVLQGPEKGLVTSVLTDDTILPARLHPGDQLLVSRTTIPGQSAAYNFVDIVRNVPLLILAAAFVVVVVLVAGLRGLIALLGLGFAGAVMLRFVLPALLAGSNPYAVGLVGSLVIVLVVLYLTHGPSVRTTTALLGTVAGVGVSALLAWIAVRATHLTGAATEDDLLLHQTAPQLSLASVVVCATIIAGLGVLNDVTITQSSAVWELAEAGVVQRRDLFRRAMRIGRDHIASSVYTIAFVWAGASLGTLLLVVAYDRPLLTVATSELVAGEIVSTLVGSIALVLSMPLTTAIACAVIAPRPQPAAP